MSDNRRGLCALEAAREEISKACYDYIMNFMGVADYPSFLDFLMQETECRQYLEFYFVDKLIKNPDDIQQLFELGIFACEALENHFLLEDYFRHTIITLLDIPQLAPLHGEIRIIVDRYNHFLKTNAGERMSLDDFLEETSIKA